MPVRRLEIVPRAGTYQRRSVWPKPRTPGFSARAMYRLHKLLEPNRAYSVLARWLERHGRLGRWFTAAEESVKTRGFGCRMCGQCALPVTGYACPMTCPKQLRNGPCGGVGPGGECEVHPQERCVWVVAYERAEAENHLADLTLLQRPIDHRQWGQSSWVNYWQGRDEGLFVTAETVTAPAAAVAATAAESARTAETVGTADAAR